MDYAKAFIVGGLTCVVAQILMEKTKMSSGKILVLFVCIGCLLGGLGIYAPFMEFAGSGASVPLPGFGYLLAKGAIDEVDKFGIIGAFTGGLKAAAGGITFAMLFGFLAALFFNPKEKG